MPLLDGDGWQGRIYSGGWTDGSGEPYDVVSPSTGETLGAVRAGHAGRRTQGRRRGRRRAARLGGPAIPGAGGGAAPGRRPLARHTEEIIGWLMRETGAIGPFGGFQVMTSAEECYEAAALASAPYGELLRSALPRLSHGARGCRSAWSA